MEKRRYGKIIVGLVVLFTMMMACSMPSSGGGGVTGQTATAIVATFIAQMTQKAQVPVSAAPPVIYVLMATPQPAAVPTAAQIPAAQSIYQCNNRAQFVADITVLDGTAFYPGSGFVKTWRLMNVGNCTWDSGYQLIFSGGSAMGAPSAISLTSGTIPPGGTVDVSVSLVAPGSYGSYQDFFNLRAPDGSIFGIGDSGTSSFWVRIQVVPVVQQNAGYPYYGGWWPGGGYPGVDHRQGFWNNNENHDHQWGGPDPKHGGPPPFNPKHDGPPPFDPKHGGPPLDPKHVLPSFDPKNGSPSVGPMGGSSSPASLETSGGLITPVPDEPSVESSSPPATDGASLESSLPPVTDVTPEPPSDPNTTAEQ